MYVCLQIQQNILLTVKQPVHPQAPATNQFSPQQDVPVDKVVIASSANTGAPAQLPSVLQPTSVLIKTPAPGSETRMILAQFRTLLDFHHAPKITYSPSCCSVK